MNFDFSKLLSFLSSGFTKDEDNIDKSYFPPSSSHPSSRTIVTVSSLQFPGSLGVSPIIISVQEQ